MDDNSLPKFDILPQHIGFIMDGNGRWAQQRGLPRYKGHIEGAKTFRVIGEYAADIGIKCMTFYAFSTENWRRPKEEVNAIMDLFRDYLKEADERKAENEEKGIHMTFLGDRSLLPMDMKMLMNKIERVSGKQHKVTVNIAINYGSREEITHSAREIAKLVKAGKLSPDDITEDTVSGHLYTAGQPDPDLIIRPSGEHRLSNFMLWQAAYAEFWSSNVLWPDFSKEDLNEALREFEKRNRRFGGV
jgi:undecaprenyl diphosphate synthase